MPRPNPDKHLFNWYASPKDFRELKTVAALNGMTINDAVTQAVLEYLESRVLEMMRSTDHKADAEAALRHIVASARRSK
jgi:hypothetical protein